MIRTRLDKVSLHNGLVNHDKLYILELVELTADAGKVLGYNVESRYGRRGKSLKATNPDKFQDLVTATAAYAAKKNEKLGKGYVEVVTDSNDVIITDVNAYLLAQNIAAPVRNIRMTSRQELESMASSIMGKRVNNTGETSPRSRQAPIHRNITIDEL